MKLLLMAGVMYLLLRNNYLKKFIKQERIRNRKNKCQYYADPSRYVQDDIFQEPCEEKVSDEVRLANIKNLLNIDYQKRLQEIEEEISNKGSAVLEMDSFDENDIEFIIKVLLERGFSSAIYNGQRGFILTLKDIYPGQGKEEKDDVIEEEAFDEDDVFEDEDFEDDIFEDEAFGDVFEDEAFSDYEDDDMITICEES